MQEKLNCIVLVQANLLFRKKSGKFRALWKCISKLDFTKVELYDEFVYNSETREVELIRQPLRPNYPEVNLIHNKIQRGYILIDLIHLKKILSL